ncbi:MAG: hypothetical protein M3362_22740, partial [Acidobacteriota bacterium]|nr:hypothetical protein [Acidobacteriota bacterium]
MLRPAVTVVIAPYSNPVSLTVLYSSTYRNSDVQLLVEQHPPHAQQQLPRHRDDGALSPGSQLDLLILLPHR